MVVITYVSQLVTPSLYQHAEMDVSAQPAIPIVFPDLGHGMMPPMIRCPLSPLINLSLNALTDMSQDLSPTNMILNPVKWTLSIAHPSLMTKPLYLTTSKCVFEGYNMEHTFSHIFPCWAFGMYLQVMVQMRGVSLPHPTPVVLGIWTLGPNSWC